MTKKEKKKLFWVMYITMFSQEGVFMVLVSVSLSNDYFF